MKYFSRSLLIERKIILLEDFFTEILKLWELSKRFDGDKFFLWEKVSVGTFRNQKRALAWTILSKGYKTKKGLINFDDQLFSLKKIKNFKDAILLFKNLKHEEEKLFYCLSYIPSFLFIKKNIFKFTTRVIHLLFQEILQNNFF